MSTAGTDDFVETVVPVTHLQHGEARQARNQSILDGRKAACCVLIVVVIALSQSFFEIFFSVLFHCCDMLLNRAFALSYCNCDSFLYLVMILCLCWLF
jgi:hypothetical protein